MAKEKDLVLKFTVIPVDGKAPKKAKFHAYLLDDRWDDWSSYRTQFYLVVFDEKGEEYRLGHVKIGQFGLRPGSYSEEKKGLVRAADVPSKFEALSDSFFSLGQDQEYYETLYKLGPSLRLSILHGLCDVVYDQALWGRSHDEKVMEISLLRSVSRKTAEGQFRRLLEGSARLTPYSFSYTYPISAAEEGERTKLVFRVKPDSTPPTNVHVIIGGNGVGKTYTLTQMVKALAAGGPHEGGDYGAFNSTDNEWGSDVFANVVMVSFSAFDPFDTIDSGWEIKDGIKHSYIGLKEYDGPPKRANKPKSPEQLVSDLRKRIGACLIGGRRKRWIKSLETLESDPVFSDFGIRERLSHSLSEKGAPHSDETLDTLSSGHKIVLLTIAGLVETVEERSLVLLDEPESHLHPPLLSAFIRTLSDLLVDRNGVAIIATHSPIILQEVPHSCVWKLRRIGGDTIAERPEIETFGENIGVLTREVFRLEITKAGFHNMLREAAKQSETYDDAVDHFNGTLGGEARGILRALMAIKTANGSID
jgi:hypothetical protein